MKTIKFNIYKITIYIATILLIVGVTTSSIPVYAENDETASYGVNASIPDNQIDKKLSYFDLLMYPEQKQTIQINVSNKGSKEIVADISVNAASTGENGAIVYSLAGIRDTSMLYSIEDIAVVKQPVVSIPGNSTAVIDIELTMPLESYNGVILGGIVVNASSAEELEKTNEETGVQIENKIAYIVGLKLSETEVELTPNMNLQEIRPTVSALRTAMAINLQNSEAMIMKDVKINAEIYKKGDTSILHSAFKDTVEIAPNSIFDFIVDWENQTIQPGTYRLKMRVDYEEHTWEWDEEFEVKSEDASRVNAEAINIDNSIPLWVIISIALTSISIVICLVFLFRKRRKKASLNM